MSELEDIYEILNQSKMGINSENLQVVTNVTDESPENISFLFKEKLALYNVKPPRARNHAYRKMRFLAPSPCMCTDVRDLYRERAMFLAFNHRYRFQFSYYMGLLTQAGLNHLFENQLELLTFDYGLGSSDAYSTSAEEDSFISLKNLYPLFTSFVILLCLSSLGLLLEIISSLVLRHNKTRKYNKAIQNFNRLLIFGIQRVRIHFADVLRWLICTSTQARIAGFRIQLRRWI
jgi:hypothetical protein